MEAGEGTITTISCIFKAEFSTKREKHLTKRGPQWYDEAEKRNLLLINRFKVQNFEHRSISGNRENLTLNTSFGGQYKN